MAHKRLNPRLAKKHRSYSVAEAARVLAVCRATVRNWIKHGLPTVSGPGETLILGADLSEYLTKKNEARKVRCPPGTMYCIRCRAAKRPDGDETDCVPTTGGFRNLRGICPDCGLVMHRRMKRLTGCGSVQGAAHLRDTSAPSLICNSQSESEDHAKAQCKE